MVDVPSEAIQLFRECLIEYINIRTAALMLKDKDIDKIPFTTLPSLERVEVWSSGSPTMVENVPLPLHVADDPVCVRRLCDEWIEIERDLRRTSLPGVSEEMIQQITPKLRILLHYISILHRKIGYCQSMNFVGAVLIVTSPCPLSDDIVHDAALLWKMHTLTSCAMSRYWDRSLEGFNIDRGVFTAAAARILPWLSLRSRQLGVDIVILISDWFLCLFSSCAPTGLSSGVINSVLTFQSTRPMLAAVTMILAVGVAKDPPNPLCIDCPSRDDVPNGGNDVTATRTYLIATLMSFEAISASEIEACLMFLLSDDEKCFMLPSSLPQWLVTCLSSLRPIVASVFNASSFLTLQQSALQDHRQTVQAMLKHNLFSDFNHKQLLTEGHSYLISERTLDDLFRRIEATVGAASLVQRSQMHQVITTVFPDFKQRLIPIDALFSALDVNNDGLLDIKEVYTGFALLLNGSLDKKMSLCFRMFDKDRNGGLDRQEIKDLMSCMLRVLYGRHIVVDYESEIAAIYASIVTTEDSDMRDNLISEELFKSSTLLRSMVMSVFDTCCFDISATARQIQPSDMLAPCGLATSSPRPSLDSPLLLKQSADLLAAIKTYVPASIHAKAQDFCNDLLRSITTNTVSDEALLSKVMARHRLSETYGTHTSLVVANHERFRSALSTVIGEAVVAEALEDILDAESIKAARSDGETLRRHRGFPNCHCYVDDLLDGEKIIFCAPICGVGPGNPPTVHGCGNITNYRVFFAPVKDEWGRVLGEAGPDAWARNVSLPICSIYSLSSVEKITYAPVLSAFGLPPIRMGRFLPAKDNQPTARNHHFAVSLRTHISAAIVIQFGFPTKVPAEQFLAIVRGMCTARSMLNAFAYAHLHPSAFYSDGHRSRGKIYDVISEYSRLGALSSKSPPCRLTVINTHYRSVPTYPEQLIVPASITDDVITQAIKFRSSRRFPVLSWCRRAPDGGYGMIARASQPRVGVTGARNSFDEGIVAAFFKLANCSTQRFVFDCRGRTAAGANRYFRRGGIERPSVYGDATVIYGNIPNIHSLRHALHSLQRITSKWTLLKNNIRATISPVAGDISLDLRRRPNETVDLPMTAPSSSRWVVHQAPSTNDLEVFRQSQWAEILRVTLRAADQVSAIVDVGGVVLVHCSDGWDRTPCVSALAQLLIDSFYRSLWGFQILIEKEWLSFGHRFSTRAGHFDDGTKHHEEVSPVFVQWLDCVWQLLQLFPDKFEFNERLLLELAVAVYSGRFGTFLGDNEAQRSRWETRQNAASLWTHVKTYQKVCTNQRYLVSRRLPQSVFSKPENANGLTDRLFLPINLEVRLWEDYYLGVCRFGVGTFFVEDPTEHRGCWGKLLSKFSRSGVESDPNIDDGD